MLMTRKKKLLFNTITSLAYQFITVVVGFILPRYYLKYFGSDVNGLINSITNFLGFITLLNSGVGMVVQSALYKPLADKDEDQVSRIIISSERFFQRIAYILIAYVVVLITVYPFAVKDSFSYVYTALLIGIISISSFAQYYFGLTYRFLLNADQRSYVQLIIDGVATIINTILVIGLIKIGGQLHLVRLVTSIVYVGQVICLRVYVKQNYKLNKELILNEEPIKQKWNGLAQHIASVILTNTDTVVLTLFSTLKDVSIYAVYHMVVNGVKTLVNALTAGLQALFGNMLARNEMKTLDETFSVVEWLMHTIVTIGFTMTAVLIVPFVQVYTNGITDADYIVPSFAIIITLAQGVYCIRLPYNMIVLAAGHYKETQSSAIIEAILNIVISIATVIKYGLVGVAIGTLIAMAYRTCYLAWYLKDHIINRSLSIFLKHIIVDGISAIGIWGMTHCITISTNNYLGWVIMAIKTGIISLCIVGIVNFIFYRSTMVKSIEFIKSRRNN